MAQSRNSLCGCGSGKRYKECCGVASDPYFDISDATLEHHVRAADDEGLVEGQEPKRRAFENVLRVLKRLEIDGVVLVGARAPPIVRRIRAANEKLFRRQDMQVGGIHLGAFMFRDIFCRLHVPVPFGAPAVDFLKLIDLSEYQKRWLDSDATESARFMDQAVDLLDFGLGWMEFGHGLNLDPRSTELIFRGHIQLEAAAAIATGDGDYRGVIQSAQLGVELTLKAGLAAHGVNDDDLRVKFGHNLAKAAKRLQQFEPNLDVNRILRVISTFPDYVKSRYSGLQPARQETGHILMGAQFIASDVTRQFSDRNLRRDHPDMPARSYPR